MKTSGTSRLLTAIVAIFSMLFMQLAVASYVCPRTSSGTAENVTSAIAMSEGMSGDMANCDGMDPVQSTLCHTVEHDALIKQSLDKTPVQDVPPFMPLALMSDLKFFDVIALPPFQTYPPIALTRTSAPPIAIRNCCFRI